MPDLHESDHVEFFVVPTTKAAELAALAAELAQLAAIRANDDDDEPSGNQVDDLLLKLERMSTRSVPHAITVHPRGAPALAYYAKKYGLLSPEVDYDPHDYLGHLYSGGIELTSFPLLLVNFFQGVPLSELVSKMRKLLAQPLFPNEREQMAAAHAVLSDVDPATEVVVLWYVQGG